MVQEFHRLEGFGQQANRLVVTPCDASTNSG